MGNRVGGSDTPEIAEAVEARYVAHVTGNPWKGLLVVGVAAVGALVAAVAVAHWLWRLSAVVWAAT